MQFLTTNTWAPNYVDPVTGVTTAQIGALPMVAGTMLSSVIALPFAAPIGVLVAVYPRGVRAETARDGLTFVVELIAAIPSVVIGLWGLYLFAPFTRDTIQWWIASTLGKIVPFLAEDPQRLSRFSVLTAGMVLTIMILPMIVALSREVIRSVPLSVREGFAGSARRAGRRSGTSCCRRHAPGSSEA